MDPSSTGKSATAANAPLLEVKGLRTQFMTQDGVVKAVVLGDGRRIELRDWTAIEVDSRGLVADVDAVLRQCAFRSKVITDSGGS